jgi:hypothetical protein
MPSYGKGDSCAFRPEQGIDLPKDQMADRITHDGPKGEGNSRIGLSGSSSSPSVDSQNNVGSLAGGEKGPTSAIRPKEGGSYAMNTGGAQISNGNMTGRAKISGGSNSRD